MNERDVSRRDVLKGLGAAVAGSIVSVGTTMTQNSVPARDALDHLLLGAPNLDAGIAWVERRTGIRAAVGGSHPGAGTRNALLTLGGRQYLEIIAPDPAQTAYTFPMDLRSLTEPRLVWWAAGTTDIEAVAQRAREAGGQPLGPRDGSRSRPDGKLLEWRTLAVQHTLAAGGVDPIPFFIQWAFDSLHPSQDSPPGCRLESFAIEHSNPAAVEDLLRQLRIEASVTKSSRVRLIATVTSKNGEVTLS